MEKKDTISVFSHKVNDDPQSIYNKTMEWINQVPLKPIKTEGISYIETGWFWRTVGDKPKFKIIIQINQDQNGTEIKFTVLNVLIKKEKVSYFRIRIIEIFEDYLHMIDENLNEEYLRSLYPDNYFSVLEKRSKASFYFIGGFSVLLLLIMIGSSDFFSSFFNKIVFVLIVFLCIFWVIIEYREKNRRKRRLDRSKSKLYPSVGRGDWW